MERYGDMKNNEGYCDPTAGAVLRKADTSPIRRGDIVYVSIPFSTGHEMQKDRPGIVVSCNELNETSPCINVVLCSGTASKRELPEHVLIRSTPVMSTAMCEHICTVDRSRIGKKVGHVTPGEMNAVQIAMMTGLALDDFIPDSADAANNEQHIRFQEYMQNANNEIKKLREEISERDAAAAEQAASCQTDEKPAAQTQAVELVRIEAERDVYKTLYTDLLERMSIERRASA